MTPAPTRQRRASATGPAAAQHAHTTVTTTVNPTVHADLGRAALDYAAAGWPVFPLQAGDKRPRAGSRGLHDASTDLELVARWWDQTPDANIGIRTGVVVDVLDLDGPEAEHAFDAHQLANELPMPGDPDWPDAPLWAATARGLHCYVAATGSGNRTGLLGAHIDWRGAGGYVVAPPSVHPTGAQYRWIHPWAARPPACPPWLSALVAGLGADLPDPNAAPARALDPARGDATPYGAAALRAETSRVAAAPKGTRNHTLNAAAFTLFRLAGGGEVTVATVERCLAAAGRQCGLTDREIAATLRSAQRAANQLPRHAPERP